MQRAQREFNIFFVDQYRGGDFRGLDRLDIDAFFGQCFEHQGGNAGMVAHADADQRNFRDIRWPRQDRCNPILLFSPSRILCARIEITLADRKGDFGRATVVRRGFARSYRH